MYRSILPLLESFLQWLFQMLSTHYMETGSFMPSFHNIYDLLVRWFLIESFSP